MCSTKLCWNYHLAIYNLILYNINKSVKVHFLSRFNPLRVFGADRTKSKDCVRLFKICALFCDYIMKWRLSQRVPYVYYLPYCLYSWLDTEIHKNRILHWNIWLDYKIQFPIIDFQFQCKAILQILKTIGSRTWWFFKHFSNIDIVSKI